MSTTVRGVAGLYVIADTASLKGKELAASVSQAIAGGARVVQYRDKSAGSETAQRNDATHTSRGAAATEEAQEGGEHKRSDRSRRREQASALARLCHQTDVVFLVNDDVELAAEVGADGVHLGAEDMPVPAARTRLGPQAIIGMSCYNDLARAEAAVDAGANYVAFGSFFSSRSKPEAVRADPEMLRRARSTLRLPIVAIGGITPENGATLIEAGADALAVIDGLFGQVDVRAAAKRYAMLFKAPP